MQQHSWSETGMCTQGIYIILVATHCILIEPDKSRNDTITLQCVGDTLKHIIYC